MNTHAPAGMQSLSNTETEMCFHHHLTEQNGSHHWSRSVFLGARSDVFALAALTDRKLYEIQQ